MNLNLSDSTAVVLSPTRQVPKPKLPLDPEGTPRTLQVEMPFQLNQRPKALRGHEDSTSSLMSPCLNIPSTRAPPSVAVGRIFLRTKEEAGGMKSWPRGGTEGRAGLLQGPDLVTQGGGERVMMPLLTNNGRGLFQKGFVPASCREYNKCPCS